MSSGNYVGYSADLASVTDYYPFGMPMPGRNLQASWTRFGYNGKENDDEVYGEGSFVDFGSRALDTRIGRWLVVDPLSEKYPYLSPYNYVANNPNLFVDPDGERIYVYYKNGNGELVSYEYRSELKPPKNRYVKQVVKTLNKIQKKGKDPYGIIDFLATSTDHNVRVELPNPDDPKQLSGGMSINVALGVKQMEGSTVKEGIDIQETPIVWHPKVGWVSEDGKRRQSPANEILHELAHVYFTAKDIGGYTSEAQEALFKEGSAPYQEFLDKEKAEVGEYDNYADRWIIQEVESKFGEGLRKNHSEGYHLKVWFGAFSKLGNKIFNRKKSGTVGDLKHDRPLKDRTKDKKN